MPLDVIKIKNVFLAALEIPRLEERHAYVEAECGADIELRDYVRGMLEAHERHLTPVPMGSTKEDPLANQQLITPILVQGMIIDGKYKIIELIAEGGMGAVYRANRIDDMKMEVAIKIIKPGMGSPNVLARFNIERQALAIMKHENIARVFDAGQTVDGLPYFVMELVKGMPITKFCDESKLTIKERLELFEKVCSAIQHAHQKGIVHRDLKPSNIMVALYDDKAVPKVIDFGLAKALYQPLTEDTLHTHIGTFVGTWQYTAPEQAQLNNLDIDTRADIYSLGVVLYELLTGSTPVDRERITNAAYLEVLRMIREEEPPKPSTKIHSSAKLPRIAALRRSEPLQLERMVRGELDWIVMRALEKDRNRRFPTANALGADILRFLSGEPVESVPVSWTYRLRKSVRKHRGLVIAASLLLATIIIGSVVSTIGWITAEKEKRRANAQTEITVAVNDFLKELLSEADPAVQIKPDQAFISNITVKKVLDRAAEKVGTRFERKPLTEAAVRHTIGKTYMGLGDLPNARKQLEKALELRKSHSGADDVDRLESLYELGWLDLLDTKFVEAEKRLKEVIEKRAALLGENSAPHLRSKYAWGVLCQLEGRNAEAKHVFKSILPWQTAILGEMNADTLDTRAELADLLSQDDKIHECLDIYRDILLKRRQLQGKDSPDVLISINDIARNTEKLQTPESLLESERMYKEIVDKSIIINGSDHPATLGYQINLAANQIYQKKYDEGIRRYLKLIPTIKSVSGPMSYDCLGAMSNCAQAFMKCNRYNDVHEMTQELIANSLASLGKENDKTQLVIENAISLYKEMGRKDEVEKLKKFIIYPDRSK